MAELLVVAAFVLAYLGFVLLALSLHRHWRDVTGKAARAPQAVRRARLSGCGTLTASFVLAVTYDGPAFGSVLGTLLFTAAAVGVALTLSWRPRWLSILARLCGATASLREER